MQAWQAVAAVVLAWILYGPAADGWFRFVDPRVVRHVRGAAAPAPAARPTPAAPAAPAPAPRLIALTFDDGPDPRYTPDVLRILREHGVAAAFFLVGERARRHPELVRAMVAAGHLVGNHTRAHRHAYLLTPAAAWREVEEGARLIAAAGGGEPAWFRPPWGSFNAAEWLAVRRLGQRPVMWSVIAGDWRAGTPPEVIVRRVLDRLATGAVIVLHDAGGAPGAPAQTVAALPAVIRGARQRGFEFERLDRLVDGWR
ncbi:MAG: polysaccharide deacetylase family protein [Firmicutes bacterium]|nr:polysaccharide deacetylase family protein [Bacillota bacterium]